MPAPRNATLLPLAQRLTAVSGATGDRYSAVWKKAVFLLNVTAAGGAAGDTLDVFVDVLSSDGTTWMNAVHFTQVPGNSAPVAHFAVLDSTAVAATTFNVTSDCAAGVTRPYLWGPVVRGRYTLVNSGGGGQNVTFSLTGQFLY